MLNNNDRVIVCTHIMTGRKNIREVYHEHNGDWQFMCGEDNHRDISDGLVVCVSDILNKDDSVYEILGMDRGFYAKKAEKWKIYKI